MSLGFHLVHNEIITCAKILTHKMVTEKWFFSQWLGSILTSHSMAFPSDNIRISLTESHSNYRHWVDTLIYHQNIRSLRKKLHELIGHLHPILPHVICLTEHHLNILVKTFVNIEGYTIGAQFCRVSYEKGGVIIYVHNSLQYTNIDLSKYCKEKNIEICSLKLIINSLNIFIITIYRAPSGNFNYFLQQLDNILQSFSTPTSHIIICGDLNINYLVENPLKRQLDNLLLIYNLKALLIFQQELVIPPPLL
jgi:hypothetical protein